MIGIEQFSLAGKTALVTGAGTGIGAACAEAMARAGAKVMATDIDGGTAEATAARCRDAGLAVQAMRQDVTQEADWSEAVAATLDAFGDWSVLLNNAGILNAGLVAQTDLEHVRRLNAVNIESIYLGTRAAAEAMQPGGAAGKGGSVINLSSVAGIVGTPGFSSYGATKGAVRLYTKHTAVEFAALGYGVRVNSVHPGVIETAMGEEVHEKLVAMQMVADVAAAREFVTSLTPLKRHGLPQDIANAVIFLASDASVYMTGAELVVDGGLTAA